MEAIIEKDICGPGNRACVAMCLCFASCIKLKQPYPKKRHFVLDVHRQGPAQEAEKWSSLRVARGMNIAPFFEGPASSTGWGQGEHESDYYNQFFAPPNEMMTEETRGLAGLLRALSIWWWPGKAACKPPTVRRSESWPFMGTLPRPSPPRRSWPGLHPCGRRHRVFQDVVPSRVPGRGCCTQPVPGIPGSRLGRSPGQDFDSIGGGLGQAAGAVANLETSRRSRSRLCSSCRHI